MYTRHMVKSKNAGPNSVLARAWAYDRKFRVTGEALLIATLMHTHAQERTGENFETVLKLMGDANAVE